MGVVVTVVGLSVSGDAAIGGRCGENGSGSAVEGDGARVLGNNPDVGDS